MSSGLDECHSVLQALTDKVNSADRQRLLQEVFNQRFDSALQTLVSDFLSRMEQMFPIPDFKQAASWLTASSIGVDDCLQKVGHENLRELLTNQSFSLGQATTAVCSDSEKILHSAWSHPFFTTSPPELQAHSVSPGVGPETLDVELVKVEVVVRTEGERGEMVIGHTASPVEEKIPVRISALSDQESSDISCEQEEEVEEEEEEDRFKDGPGNSHDQSDGKVGPSDQMGSEVTVNSVSSFSHNSQRVAHRCPQCSKCFIYRSQVIRHLRTNKSCSATLRRAGDVTRQDPAGGLDKEPRPPDPCPPGTRPARTLSCFQCCAAFKSKAELLVHQRSHRARPVYQCGQCDKVFHHLSSLTNHKQIHSHRGGFTCSRCHKVFSSARERDTHRLQHRPPNLSCTVCQQVFSSQTLLLRHLQSHSAEGERPQYTCRYCELSFSGVTELRIHQRTHTFRSYQCDQCSKSYGSLAGLTSHRSSHSSERRFLCSQCGKRFKTRDGLEGHLRTHSGERPFRCPYCPKDFTALAGLNVHIRRHTGERPYVCTVCGKGWPSGGDLQKHMRTHTGERPYVCQDCGKGFSISCHLTEHRRIHTGEKPFSCPECGKCLRRKFDLKKHMLSHSSVRPFACVYCPKSYTRKTHLSRHLLTHRPEAEPPDHDSNTPPAACS